MKTVLTVRQPFAWLIVNGIKDIEARTWSTHYRGPIYIHAGMKEPRGEDMDAIEQRYKLRIPDSEMVFGGIIGMVTLVDCVPKHGNWAWILADAKPLRFRSVTGRLGLFRIP